MKSLTALKHYFSKTEIILWTASVLLILCAFCLFDRTNYMTLWASLIGVTSLIFCAKGNPFGQFLMILFSLLYGIISLNVAYYGEMITYLGMTMPMAVFTFLEHFDFTEKVIRPFCTHEGSKMGSSVRDIRRICPKAVVDTGLAIRGGCVKQSGKDVEKWLKTGGWVSDNRRD